MCWWIARNKDGRWWTYSSKPTIGYNIFLHTFDIKSYEFPFLLVNLNLITIFLGRKTLAKQESRYNCPTYVYGLCTNIKQYGSWAVGYRTYYLNFSLIAKSYLLFLISRVWINT